MTQWLKALAQEAGGSEFKPWCCLIMRSNPNNFVFGTSGNKGLEKSFCVLKRARANMSHEFNSLLKQQELFPARIGESS